MKILVLGYSHIGSIMSGLARRPIEGEVNFLRLKQPEYVPNVNEDGHVNPSLLAELDKMFESGLDVVVSAISSNRHHALGLIQHRRPFDFVCASQPDLPLLEGHQVVQRTLLIERLRYMIGTDAAVVLSAIRDRTAAPIVHLDLPPPVGDEEWLLANAGQFAKYTSVSGFSPGLLRYKFWREANDIYRAMCAGLDIPVLPPPPETQDKAGFLQTRFASGPTHGSAAYGVKVLDQVLEHVQNRAAV